MKKVCLFILLLSLVLPSALGEISVADSPQNLESKIAAGEFGAKHAYFSPFDDYIYYLRSSAEGSSVVIFDAKTSSYKTVKTFTPDAEYISVGVDSDGNIYLLRQDRDETAKSGIVCLKKEADEYIATEYLFPAASCDMIPVSMEFSPYSSMGVMRFMLNSAGDYVSFISPISVFWGTLMGYNELVYIVPGELTCKVQPMDAFFDAYGYQTDAAEEFLKKVESGEYLTVADASLSPSGNMLLMTVPFNGEKLVYVMDLYTNQLEILYLPDEFSGVVSWTNEGTIIAIDDSGKEETVEFNGFSAGEWDQAFTDDWASQGESGLSDWN